MSDVDVIVLDIDGGEMLQECLESVLAQSTTPRRVMVFDNGSSVPAQSRVPEKVEVLRSESNRGF
ncbi:MAG TPA: hypothetical protein VFL80_07410, partial [Thermoanaerobaculia bacterium]|nr:hypothetical protein [Thermoanaerobaculia bacterium]